MKKKVLVGMSGGIDSSVAALLLKKEGFEVIGVTLKHLPDELSEDQGKTCCSIDDINDAKNVCSQLDIPHYVFNVTEEFEKEVMDYFVKMYDSGKTPSPCVICDEKIKLKKLLEIADKMGVESVATGHYSSKTSENLLLWDKNNQKDQTYMLYRLGPNVLEKMLFPLEKYKKDEVREIAKAAGIKIFSKPDSQGICFAPSGYELFLKKKLGSKITEGNYLDENGNILGKHKGYQLYTVGQRRKLGLNLGKIYFVLKIIPEENEIILGDFNNLQRDKIEIINYKFYKNIENILEEELTARPRFSSKGLIGKLISKENKIYFKFNKMNAENAEGQHIVFYLNNILLGGGEIKFSEC